MSEKHKVRVRIPVTQRRKIQEKKKEVETRKNPNRIEKMQFNKNNSLQKSRYW